MVVRVEGELTCDETREEYQRVWVEMMVEGGKGELWASSTGGQRSSRIGSFKGANGLVRLKPGGGVVRSGEWVECFLMGPIGGIAN